MEQSLIFLAELKSVNAKKLVSNDIEYKLTLVTDDANILELGRLPSDTLLEVKIQNARRQTKKDTKKELKKGLERVRFE